MLVPVAQPEHMPGPVPFGLVVSMRDAPLDLGLNDDPREFSLRIWDIDVPSDPGESIEEASLAD